VHVEYIQEMYQRAWPPGPVAAGVVSLVSSKY